MTKRSPPPTPYSTEPVQLWWHPWNSASDLNSVLQLFTQLDDQHCKINKEIHKVRRIRRIPIRRILIRRIQIRRISIRRICQLSSRGERSWTGPCSWKFPMGGSVAYLTTNHYTLYTVYCILYTGTICGKAEEVAWWMEHLWSFQSVLYVLPKEKI